MVSRIAILLAALMVVGGVTQAATYTKEADVDGTIGLSYTSAPDYVNNFGEGDIRVGWGSYQIRRAIMRFDIDWSGLSAVTAATLQIDTMSIAAAGDSNYSDLKLALVTEHFTGGAFPDTTYYVRTTGTNWTTAGGSPDTATEIDVSIPTSYSSYDLDVLSLIQVWQANKSGYTGLIFYDPSQSTTNNAYSRIYSTESDPDLHRHPTLVIVPEPASLALLAMGGIGVLLRRRRR